ncbi:transmembrane protein 268 isoform X1 [Lepisosteus oculatus]|uniref:transmembrane protein 268 isoform X1 n=1 Tax=Lepisosteus oculatus TaxID=7918 RepID=UPI00371FD4CA
MSSAGQGRGGGAGPFYCKAQDDQEGVLRWEPELQSGQVVLGLTGNILGSAGPGFNLEAGTRILRDRGIQVTSAELSADLQGVLQDLEIRRYIFLTSRLFTAALALVCYVCLWLNLYCSLRALGVAMHWSLGVWVSLASALGTAGGLLILHRRRSQLNVNTDVRMAAVNEKLLKHKLLAGLTGCTDRHPTALRLWMVHFDLCPCRQALAELMEHWSSSHQLELQSRLSQVCVVVTGSSSQSKEEGKAGLTEEVPLLASVGRGGGAKQLSVTQCVCLIPNGTPQCSSSCVVLGCSLCHESWVSTGRTSADSHGLQHCGPREEDGAALSHGWPMFLPAFVLFVLFVLGTMNNGCKLVFVFSKLISTPDIMCQKQNSFLSVTHILNS